MGFFLVVGTYVVLTWRELRRKYSLQHTLAAIDQTLIQPTFKPDSNWTFPPICSMLML